MANIKFGTDGWRAIVDEDFTCQNVEIVTNAIAKYVFDNFGINKKILIGYDPREKAKEFAMQSAEIFAKSGFEVLFSKEIIPTPALAYNAKILDACAVMFTASHNPPQYLGMKFIPDYAGPATDEISNEIMANLDKTLSPKEGGKVVEYDFKENYFEHIKTLIDFEKIKTLKTNIIYDGLYSATISYFDKLLDEFSISYKSIHTTHDPNFGGGMPEPKPKYLKELIDLVCANPNSVGVANDGDGDRFGVINEDGHWVSPNEIIAILLLYLKNYKKLDGKLIKTVGASLLLDKIAEKADVEVVETAVGFKHVGEAMREHDPIIGGEESGGLSIQGHIPEKDGILANLLVLEAMATTQKPLNKLQEELYELIGMKFYTNRVDLKLENDEQIKSALEKTKNISEFNGMKVIKTDTKDGVKLYFDDNSSWILVRASGTEPLLRIYIESDTVEKVNSFKNIIYIVG